MNIVVRTGDRTLLSLATTKLEVIEQALDQSGASEAAKDCLARLREQLGSRPMSGGNDSVEVWADGASIQVRAITAHGDPVDMGSEEARDFARRILGCTGHVDRKFHDAVSVSWHSSNSEARSDVVRDGDGRRPV
jgi:hypothetical protein